MERQIDLKMKKKIIVDLSFAKQKLQHYELEWDIVIAKRKKSHTTGPPNIKTKCCVDDKVSSRGCAAAQRKVHVAIQCRWSQRKHRNNSQSLAWWSHRLQLRMTRMRVVGRSMQIRASMKRFPSSSILDTLPPPPFSISMVVMSRLGVELGERRQAFVFLGWALRAPSRLLLPWLCLAIMAP